MRHFEIVVGRRPVDAPRRRESCGTARSADVEWLHVGPVLRSDFPAETLAELAAGRRLSYDGQGLVRRPEPGPLAARRRLRPALLEHVSILKLAEEEAIAAAGSLEPAALAALGPREVLVTFGSRGRARRRRTGRPSACGRTPSTRTRPARVTPSPPAISPRARSGLAPLAAARRATSLVGTLLAGRRL